MLFSYCTYTSWITTTGHGLICYSLMWHCSPGNTTTGTWKCTVKSNIICLTVPEVFFFSSVTHVQRNERIAEQRTTEILKYLLQNYFSMENSNNRSNKKAIMEVLCRGKATRNKSTFMWNQSGSAVELIFNYKRVM